MPEVLRASDVRLATGENTGNVYLDLRVSDSGFNVYIPLCSSLIFWTVGDQVVYYNLPTNGVYRGSSHLLAEYFAVWYNGDTYRFRKEDVDNLDDLYEVLESWGSMT